MKNFIKNTRWFRFVMAAVLILVAVGFVVRKPLLISYHRNAMVTIWQTELGLSEPKGLVVSVRKFLGQPAAALNSNPQAAVRAFSHREALLNLGYFTKRKFTLSSVSIGSEDYQKLCERVAAETGQQPTAQFDYDQPTAPRRVLGLFVYATTEEIPRWEQFILNLKLADSTATKSGQGVAMFP